jgi:hypothetical protein
MTALLTNFVSDILEEKHDQKLWKPLTLHSKNTREPKVKVIRENFVIIAKVKSNFSCLPQALNKIICLLSLSKQLLQ